MFSKCIRVPSIRGVSAAIGSSARFASKTTASDDVVIVSAVRTPIGSFRGAFTKLSATQLGQQAVRAAVARAGVQPKEVCAVYFGNVVQAGVGQDPARQCTLGAGLPESTPTTTVNKVCASGMKTVSMAAESIKSGNATIMVAGGCESMSNTPFMLNRGEIPFGGAKLIDSLQFDGLTDVYSGKLMGVCAEQTAAKLSITREQQDAYTVMTYKRAQNAINNGVFAKEIVAVKVADKARGKGAEVEVKVDEEVGRVKFDKIPQLATVFAKQGGTITAANASKMSDGAAALVVMSAAEAARRSAKPLARIVAWADSACAPVDFAVAPETAVRRALQRAGLRADRIALWEINEAFACVALANVKLLELDVARVNVHGGAVALGHPLGMSGARIVTHLAHALEPAQFGCAAICNGGGGASAIIIEKL